MPSWKERRVKHMKSKLFGELSGRDLSIAREKLIPQALHDTDLLLEEHPIMGHFLRPKPSALITGRAVSFVIDRDGKKINVVAHFDAKKRYYQLEKKRYVPVPDE